MPVSPSQNAFTGGEWSPSAYGRNDIEKALIACKTMLNWFSHAEGGASTRPGTEFIVPTKFNDKVTRLIPFSYNGDDTYAIEMGHLYMRFVRNGAQIVYPDKTVTGITNANPAVVTATAHGFNNGDSVYLSGVGGMNEANIQGPFTVANKTTDTFQLSGVNSSAWGTYTSGGVAQKIAEIVTPYVEADLFKVKFTQSNNVMTLTHPGYQARELTRTDHHLWTLTAITFAPLIGAPTSAVVTPATAGALTYKYAVTSVAAETFEESVALLGQTTAAATLSSTNYITVSWTAPVSGTVAKYNVYRESNGVYGFIGTSQTLSFKDDFIEQDFSNTIQTQRDPISTTNKYPRAVGLYQQRRIFGGSYLTPATWWTTQTGNYYNLNTSSPLKASDAITLTLTAGKADAIQHILALSDLIILTDGAIWLIKPDGGVLAADTPPDQKPQEYHGVSSVPPLVTGSTALVIQNKGQIVRDLGYLFETDKYQGSDINVLARHMVKGKTIVDWCYAEAPFYLVWAILSDGKMMACTYLPEYKVIAWHRHETDGLFKSTCSISEGDEDAVYYIVRRTVNEQTVQYIERLHTRNFTEVQDAFFVDCGLTYDGSPTTTISGLKHLIGREVSILADGNVHPKVTVQENSYGDGYVTLQREVSKAHIGIGYVCDLAPLDWEVQTPMGSSTGKVKTVGELHLYVTQTRGYKAGVDASKLTEKKPEMPAQSGDPIPMSEGVVSLNLRSQWRKQGSVLIRVEDPTPMTINKMVPEIEIGTL